jgi:hypothetical protein
MPAHRDTANHVRVQGGRDLRRNVGKNSSQHRRSLLFRTKGCPAPNCSALRFKRTGRVLSLLLPCFAFPLTTRFQTLKPGCVVALRRIFHICDLNKDGILDDSEINEFQVCSSSFSFAPLLGTNFVRSAEMLFIPTSVSRACWDKRDARLDVPRVRCVRDAPRPRWRSDRSRLCAASGLLCPEGEVGDYLDGLAKVWLRR